MDFATPSEFNGEFLAQPASEICGKAYKLLKMIPVILKVELVPIGNLLNDLFVNRNPALSDVEMYIFPDDKNTKRYSSLLLLQRPSLLCHCYHKTYDSCRFKEDHAHLFETMRTRSAMIRINIKDTPLLIFSSKQLDKSSQSKPNVFLQIFVVMFFHWL